MSIHSRSAHPVLGPFASRQRPIALVVTIVASLTVAACSQDSVSAPASALTAVGRSELVTVAPQTIQVCKTGPAGTYSFTLSAVGGNSNPGDVVLPSPFLLVVPAGSTSPVCTSIFTRTQSDGPTSDAPANISVTEAAAAGTTLASITAVTAGGPNQQPVVDLANRKATLFINAYHGTKATFNNVAVAPTPGKCDEDSDRKDKKKKDTKSSDEDSDCRGKKDRHKKCDADFSKKDPKVHDENHDCRSEQGEKSDKKFREG